MKNIQQVFNREFQHNKSAERTVFISQKFTTEVEGPQILLDKKQTSTGITVRTGSTAYAVSMNEV
jgi:hypothetical protein